MANNLPELRIREVPAKLHEELMNVSKHLDVGIREIIIPKLREIIDSYPPHYKKPPMRD